VHASGVTVGEARLLGPVEVRALAAELGLRPTKRLGQNFVHDANTVRRIVRAADLRPDDVVLEVGPGLGSLTLALLPEVAAVHAVEIDPVLAARLPATVADRAPALLDRLTVHAADALRLRAGDLAAGRAVGRKADDPVGGDRAADREADSAAGALVDRAAGMQAEQDGDFAAGRIDGARAERAADPAADRAASAEAARAADLAADRTAGLAAGGAADGAVSPADLTRGNGAAADRSADGVVALPTALVANLPYNVAVPVVLHLLAELPGIRRGLVMVQAEVAERLAAAPGSRAYGVPSAKLAWFAAARRAGPVPRSVFWPVPGVDSGLLAFDRRDPPPGDRAAVFAVVDAAFAQRRKVLRSALAGWAGSPSAAEAALRAAGVDPGARAETLTITDFARIAAAR
jgi:16S rRNA (adenine1518-N6/adenine1519-N6)-dimethyltransferase